eukprot:753861-Hanusia_phi.AAC.8
MSLPMNWQHPRMDPYGSYVDPYGHGGMDYLLGVSQDDQHFLSSGTTREYEELARRKAEHMEAAEHIAPQHNHPMNAVRLTEKVLREHFHLPLVDVARKFGMCTTAYARDVVKKEKPFFLEDSLRWKGKSFLLQHPTTAAVWTAEGDKLGSLYHDLDTHLALHARAIRLPAHMMFSTTWRWMTQVCDVLCTQRLCLTFGAAGSVGSNSSQPEERQAARARNSNERSDEDAFHEGRDHSSLLVKQGAESSARPENFEVRTPVACFRFLTRTQFTFGGDFMRRNMQRGRGMIPFQDYHDPYGCAT